MYIFGPNELAVRLPSAVAAAATAILVSLFCALFLKDRIAGVAAPAVLLTSVGFTGEHVARGGDYDSLLVLFVTVFLLCGFAFGRTQQRRFIVAGSAALSLAIMTKGIAGLMMAPGLFLWFVTQRRLWPALLRVDVLAGVIAALALPLIVYLATEFHQPGYLEAVVKNELWGRFGSLVEGGTPRDKFYYLRNFMAYKFVPWIYFLPLCLTLSHPFIRFGAAVEASFLFIISASQTRFPWYDAPFYPVASICVALLISSFISASRLDRISGWKVGVLLSAFFFLPAYKNLFIEVVRESVPYRDNDKREALIARSYADALDTIAKQNAVEPGATLSIANGARYNMPLLFVTRRAEANLKLSINLNWKVPFEAAAPAGDTC